MARLVKCSVTKELGYASEFIKIGNKYYKNQEVYDNHKKEKENFNKVFEKIAELLGYSNKRIAGSTGGFVTKKIKNSSLSEEELYKALVEKEEYIREIFGENISHNLDNQHVLIIFKIIETMPEPITYGGCYEIKNLDSGEIYIGETLDFFKRITLHISDLYANKHHCIALQTAFNKCNDISHFTFTPLYLYEIKNKDKEFEKHNTLYLECAFYLKYVYNKKKLYNTVNPYIALKENSVCLTNYLIDCKKVLELLLKDEQNILPPKIKTKIDKYLKQ